MPPPPGMRIDCGNALLVLSDGHLTIDWGRFGMLSLPAAWCGDAQVLFAAGELQFSCRFTAPTSISGSPDLVTFRLSVPAEHGGTAFQIAQALREAGSAASDPPDRWEASPPAASDGVPPADGPSWAGHAPGSTREPSHVREPQRHADGRWEPEESRPADPADLPVQSPTAPAPQGQAYGAPEGRAYGAPEGRAYGAPEGRAYGAPEGRAYGAPEGRAYGAPGSFGGAPGGSPISPGTPEDVYGHPREAASDRLGTAGPVAPTGGLEGRGGMHPPRDAPSADAGAPGLWHGIDTSPPADEPWGPAEPVQPAPPASLIESVRPAESVRPVESVRTRERGGTHPLFDPGRADRPSPLEGTPGQAMFSGRTASEAPPLFPASSADRPSADPSGVRTVTTAPENDQWVGFRPGPDTERLIARLPQRERPGAADDAPGEERRSRHG
ncbi:hypothetical protein [Actinoallomurus soli]|uniref:hypothetical protein n=1 Tax=Actinoallomurus soli TaxID=2952535 RepID=UPI0020926BA8|nr:hypothetical protein [Actinoallomurus soli]MCO5968318.1 hypothetical protein [Actinoallomurus soli]